MRVLIAALLIAAAFAAPVGAAKDDKCSRGGTFVHRGSWLGGWHYVRGEKSGRLDYMLTVADARRAKRMLTALAETRFTAGETWRISERDFWNLLEPGSCP